MRVNYGKLEPNARDAILELSKYVRSRGLDQTLLNLIEIRASQINGCAYCLDMHTQDAIAVGEKEQRIFCISAWRESPFFTERERVVLELTEAVTKISERGVPDDLFKRVMGQFSEKEFVVLLMAINTINCWNRMAISCGYTAGLYRRNSE